MIPSSIRAGDSLLIATDFSTQFPQYSADAGFALSLTLVGPQQRYELTGAGTPLTFSANAKTTAGWVPDTYTYIVTFNSATERHTVASGTTRVLPDVASQATYDGRTHAQRTLDAIEAVIEKRATSDQQQYTIAGRSLTKMPVSDLFRLRDTYRMEVMREQRATDLANGVFKGGNAIWARL